MSFPRYPAYKDSGVKWLGEVPEHWDVAPLKRMLSLQNGSDHKHIECLDGYPVIGSGGPFACASEFMHDGESVLLGRKGTIDKPLYVSGKFWTVDTMYWSKIQPGAFGRFAFYSALTIPFAYYSTNTALPSMTKSVLEAHLLGTPPEQEQIAIAQFLDHETAKIDALVAEQERLIELLKEKRQAVISHAVTKGLDPSVPMKDSGVEWLGNIPAHWQMKPLKFLGTITSGYAFKSTDFSSDGVRVLKISNVQTYSLDWSDDSYLPDYFYDQHLQFAVKDGDVIFALTRPIISTGLKAAIARIGDERILLNQRNATFRPAGLVDRLYVYQFLFSDSFRVDFENKIDATGQQPNISPIDIGDIRIPVPPVNEQAEIAMYLEKVRIEFNALIAETQRCIDLLHERRTAVISAAVTGQVDVREAAS